ncbi:MAG: hypothetical protein ACFFKA_13630, partial [Candidatus Thorarchaeota archaeon]
MNPDKNYNILEKHLKILGQKIRLDILTKLDNYIEPMPYSVLQKEVLGPNINATNFSFHLKTLKKHNLIESTGNGYSLSKLGKQILQKIVSIEQILSEQKNPLMIRTSKYSKEPFDTDKIEEYLIKEGKLERDLSKKIAREVEERLSKTNITYLTTPLMREYINGILLENGLEEVRHRLTRLGTPPFEVENYFTMVSLNPEQFLSKLGSDSSEQFLLLNLLPKNLSDLYLSGDIILLNLNYWSLRPISLYIDSNTILGCIKNCNYTSKRLALKFFDIIKLLKPYISEDIVLGQFNTSFLNQFDDVAQFNKILEIIYPIMVEINNGINVLKSYLTLHFYPDFPNQNTEDTIRLFKAYIQQTLDYDASFLKRFNNPTIMYDYSSETRTNEIIQSVLKTVPLDSLK